MTDVYEEHKDVDEFLYITYRWEYKECEGGGRGVPDTNDCSYWVVVPNAQFDIFSQESQSHLSLFQRREHVWMSFAAPPRSGMATLGKAPDTHMLACTMDTVPPPAACLCEAALSDVSSLKEALCDFLVRGRAALVD